MVLKRTVFNCIVCDVAIILGYTALPSVDTAFDIRVITQNKQLIWYSYESNFKGEYNSNVSKDYSYITLYNKVLFF